jgi:hypothetical protein
VWRHVVESLVTVMVSGEWSIVLTLYYSRIVATCLHALQALAALPARTSCKHMMTLILGDLETCMRALGTCVPSYTSRITRLFFMLEARGLQGAVGHVAAPEPTSARRRGPKP